MNDWAALPEADDVLAATHALAEALEDRAPSAEELRARAGSLTWSCASTLAHIGDAVLWYAANLACRSTVDMEAPFLSPRRPPDYLISCLRTSGALLATAVRDAPADARGYHSWGRPDRSGFAAMGCDEILVHGWDRLKAWASTSRPRPRRWSAPSGGSFPGPPKPSKPTRGRRSSG